MIKVAAPLHHSAEPTLQSIELAAFVQLPAFQIVGLPGPEVAEARERIRAAIDACGFEFPKKRLILNLAPASIRKRGTGSDLAMALAILGGSIDTKTRASPCTIVASGELGLDGRIKPAGQVTRGIYAAWKARADYIFMSADEIAEGQNAIHLIRKTGKLSGLPPTLCPCHSLADAQERLARIIKGKAPPCDETPATHRSPLLKEAAPPALLSLPPYLERAICIAAAGDHHILLLGPRGAGKSYSFEWLLRLQSEVSPSILLNHRLLSELKSGQNTGEGLENTASASQKIPVRRVSSQVRPAALVGYLGAHLLRPGEFSLAHGGILIADEFPEWNRDSREALREPLESGSVILSRSAGSATLPAAFALAANGNLCPCGGWPPQLPIPEDSAKLPRCKCTHAARNHYLSRLSGPILDRIDLTVVVVPKIKAHETRPGDWPEQLGIKVQTARSTARSAWGHTAGQLSGIRVEEILAPLDSWKQWNQSPPFGTPISLRGRHKVGRIALTLAALDGFRVPTLGHFLEAATYRIEATGLLN